MKIERLKSRNGFAASDALFAVLTITLFTGIISTLIYNIYLSNSSLKRMSKANAYIVDVFEYIDKIYYEEVSASVLVDYFNKKYCYEGETSNPKQNAEVQAIENGSSEPSTPYKVIISVQNFNSLGEDDTRLDLVKEITMTVKYKLGNKDQEITIKRVKSREKLKSPNQPTLSLINLNEDEKVYPIKEKNGIYVVCNENDSNWYNYESGKPAMVVVTKSDLGIDDIVPSADTKYRWTPRYAVGADNVSDIKYLYSNTNKYVGQQDGYEVLIEIDSSYNVASSFTDGAIGIWEPV